MADKEARRKELEAELAALDAPEADEESDIWEHPDGSFGAKLKGKRLEDWLRRKGIIAADEDIEDVTASSDPEPPAKVKGKPADGGGTVRAFGRRIS